jgi:murein DD-endopeptidase MepM/ murein hydrolase activator NlpD
MALPLALLLVACGGHRRAPEIWRPPGQREPLPREAPPPRPAPLEGEVAPEAPWVPPPSAPALAQPAFVWPLHGEVLSRFGAPRGRRWHAGLDIRGRRGEPVLAAAAGTVVFSGTMRGYGKTVIVSHGEGYETLYAHNDRLMAQPGDRVARGQPVATVGSTGNATTEHCHFEIQVNGTAVDPLAYLAGAAGETAASSGFKP